MISTLVVVYFFLFVGLSYFASRLSSSVDGFCMASRQLGPWMMMGVTVISWFDADNILGAPATFIEHGLSSTYADPIGSCACLLLIGLVIGAHFYRRQTLSLGDVYKEAYGPTISKIMTLIIIVSYLGWMSGQFLAIGLLLQILTHGYLSIKVGAVFAAIFIVLYLMYGGMWVMAIGNVFQMVILIISLVLVFAEITHQAGGISVVFQHAMVDKRFTFFPSHDAHHLIRYVTDFLTIVLGALPQQDIFQNVCASRSLRAMRHGFVTGGLLFLALCALPMLTAYSGLLITHTQHVQGDPQMYLPSIIMNHTGLFVQTIFFGAIFSALIGSSPSALLAPAISLCDFLPKSYRDNDQRYLFCIRCFIVVVGTGALMCLLCSSQNIYETITNAYICTFVAATVPLLAAMYWRKSNRTGAWSAVILGTIAWGLQYTITPDALIPPQLTGFGVSALSMIVGTYAECAWRNGRARSSSTERHPLPLLPSEEEVYSTKIAS